MLPPFPGRAIRWITVAAIFLVSTAWALRTQVIPAAAYMGGDTWEYQSMAVNFAHGHGLKVGAILPYSAYEFESDIRERYLPTFDRFVETGRGGGEYWFYRTPAYPFLLGLLYKAVGVRPDIALLVQLLVFIGIGSAVPVLGEMLLGTRGFVAGIPAGALVSIGLAPEALLIMTETLVATTLLLVVCAWILVQRRDDTLSGTAFGLTLALAIMAKGSLLFIPPMFLAYMAIRAARSGAYRTATVVAAFVAFVVPLAAYSAWASARAGRPIVITTQGRDILLDAHNERAVLSGLWSPQWKKDPASAHSAALRADPDRGSVALVAGFYLDRPARLAEGIISKLAALDGHPNLQLRLGVSWLAALCLLYALMWLVRDFGLVVRLASCSVVAIAVVAFGTDLLTCLAGIVVTGLAGLRSPAFRGRLLGVWRDPAAIALYIVPINFLLITVVTFADGRFILPALFLLLLSTFHLILGLPREIAVLARPAGEEP